MDYIAMRIKQGEVGVRTRAKMGRWYIFGETITFLLKPQQSVLGGSRAMGFHVPAQKRKMNRLASDRRALIHSRDTGKQIWRWLAGDPIANFKEVPPVTAKSCILGREEDVIINMTGQGSGGVLKTLLLKNLPCSDAWTPQLSPRCFDRRFLLHCTYSNFHVIISSLLGVILKVTHHPFNGSDDHQILSTCSPLIEPCPLRCK